jgi:anti-sigma28 factor (negative regulator of flagellin synthesis)
MSDIPPIKQATDSARVRSPIMPDDGAIGHGRSNQATETVDRVEISEMGQRLSTLDPEVEIRVDKVMQIRRAIESGAYDTETRLEAALERLLTDLRLPD